MRWKWGDCDDVAVKKRTGIVTRPKLNVAVRSERGGIPVRRL
jgi:hypothetical protein